MDTHNEFLLLFAVGFATYEYWIKRYVRLQQKSVWQQSIVLSTIIIATTVKYISLQSFVAVALFTLAYGGITTVTEKWLKGEYWQVERFVVRNDVALVLLLILRKMFTEIHGHQWFDVLWTFVCIPQFTLPQRTMLCGIGYLFVIDGGTTIVKGVLNKFPMITQEAFDGGTGIQRQFEMKNAGELIGIVERLLILTFVLAGSYEAVAFAIAAKSIARFKELDNKNFAEYYLIGTSVSVAVAGGVGVLLKSICVGYAL